MAARTRGTVQRGNGSPRKRITAGSTGVSHCLLPVNPAGDPAFLPGLRNRPDEPDIVPAAAFSTTGLPPSGSQTGSGHRPVDRIQPVRSRRHTFDSPDEGRHPHILRTSEIARDREENRDHRDEVHEGIAGTFRGVCRRLDSGAPVKPPSTTADGPERFDFPVHQRRIPPCSFGL